MDETPPLIVNVKQFTAAMLKSAKTLSPATEVWSQAALDPGNCADSDPEYAKNVGKHLF